MKNKIPTAEEFLEKYRDLKLKQVKENITGLYKPEECLIEFARLHVQAALKAAALSCDFESDADNIEESYPLTKIK